MSTATKPDYPQCATCKWWDETGQGKGWCEIADPHDDVNDAPEHAGTKAHVKCDHEFPGYLSTHADFGCVQHEPREPKENP